MLLNLKQLLDYTNGKEFAVPAFNVYNMETVMGIMAAAEETNAPVIIQCYSRLFTNGEGAYVAPLAVAAAEMAHTPVCFHLDHGAGEAEVMKALRGGATGIMIDGSAYSFEENVALTKRVRKLCDALGVPVEAELGHVGTVNDEHMADFTEVSDAVKFIQETGVASLAVMVGTAHGRYKKAPRLDMQRIRDISRETGIPIVLHGGSGVPDDQIKEAIKCGIRKVNFGTDVCYSFLDKVFETSRDKVALDLFMKDAVQNVKNFAVNKIKLLGADNKA